MKLILKQKNIIIILLFLLAASFLFSCRQKSFEPIHRTEFLMDTIVRITYYDPADETAVTEAFREIEALERMLSIYIPDSEVSMINKYAGSGEPVVVSGDTFRIIEESIRYAELTAGAFDISIGPLVELWDIGGGNESVPEEEKIEQVLNKVDYLLIELDPVERYVYLTKEGMRLDLGGVAKGYAVDRAKKVLLTYGVESALIDAGGDIWVIGSRPDGNPFNVGVQHPRNPQETAAVFPVENKSVVSSGDYQRYFVKNGERYHHIFDPASGRPADSGLVSVTVFGDSAMKGDILSTALFVLGVDKGLEFIESLPGKEALFIDENMEKTISSGLQLD